MTVQLVEATYQFYCLAADTKPTTLDGTNPIPNGSVLLVTDTLATYLWDLHATTWRLMPYGFQGV